MSLAVLLMVPVRRWGWVIVAIAAAELGGDLARGHGLAVSLGWTLGNCVEPVVGALLLRRFGNPRGARRNAQAGAGSPGGDPPGECPPAVGRQGRSGPASRPTPAATRSRTATPSRRTSRRAPCSAEPPGSTRTDGLGEPPAPWDGLARTRDVGHGTPSAETVSLVACSPRTEPMPVDDASAATQPGDSPPPATSPGHVGVLPGVPGVTTPNGWSVMRDPAPEFRGLNGPAVGRSGDVAATPCSGTRRSRSHGWSGASIRPAEEAVLE